jgi:transposase
MAKAMALRADHGADDLRRLARAGRDASQTRRRLALAAISEGARRTAAARIGGVGLQIVRDWVARFKAEGPAGLVDRKAPGQPPRLTLQQRVALAQAVEAGPSPEVHGVVRWRRVDLLGWRREEFDVALRRQTLGRELRRLGFRKLSARPQDHAQDLETVEAFKRKPSRRAGGHPRQAAPGNCDRALVAGVSRARKQSGGLFSRRTREWVRRRRSRAEGRGGGPGPARRTTRAGCGPTSSAPSARRRARPPAW